MTGSETVLGSGGWPSTLPVSWGRCRPSQHGNIMAGGNSPAVHDQTQHFYIKKPRAGFLPADEKISFLFIASKSLYLYLKKLYGLKTFCTQNWPRDPEKSIWANFERTRESVTVSDNLKSNYSTLASTLHILAEKPSLVTANWWGGCDDSCLIKEGNAYEEVTNFPQTNATSMWQNYELNTIRY